MGVKWIFGMLAVAVLAQLLARLLLSRKFMTANRFMNPAEILRWRFVNGEIDRVEYQCRLTKLHRMIAEGLGRERMPGRRGDQL